MQNGIVYLKSRRRMPVCVLHRVYPRDLQQDIPVGWCVQCRRELYCAEEALCRRCKGVKQYAKQGSKSLQPLYPGEESGKL